LLVFSRYCNLSAEVLFLRTVYIAWKQVFGQKDMWINWARVVLAECRHSESVDLVKLV